MAQQASSGVLLDSMLERPEFFDDRQPRMSPTSTVQTQVDYHQTPNSQSSIPTSEMQSYSDAYMPPNVARIQTRGPQVPNSQGPSSHGPFSHRPNSQNIRKTNFEQQHPSNDQRDSDAQYIVRPNKPGSTQDELDAQYLVLPKSTSDPRGEVISGQLIDNGSVYKRTASGEYADPFQVDNSFSPHFVPGAMPNGMNNGMGNAMPSVAPLDYVAPNKPAPKQKLQKLQTLQNQNTALEQRARLLDKFNARLDGWQLPSTLPGNAVDQFAGLDTYDFDTDGNFLADPTEKIVEDTTEFEEPILDFVPTQTTTRKETNLGDWKLNAEKKPAETELASAIQPPPVLPIKTPAETEPTDPPLPTPVSNNGGTESVLDTPELTPTLRQPAPAAQMAMIPPSNAEAITTTMDLVEPATFASTAASLNQAQVQQSNANVKIHPPMVQPYRKNQYTFVIENTGAKNANEVIVGITVPQWAKVTAVIPQSAQVDERTALVRFEKIEPGQQQQIHITADSLTGQPISFDATLTSKTVQNFAPGGPSTSPTGPSTQSAANALNHAPAYQPQTNQQQIVHPKAPAFDLNKALEQHVAASAAKQKNTDLSISGLPRVDATQQPGDTGRVQNPFFSHLHQAQSAQPNSPHLSAPQHANPIPQRATQTVAANTAPGPRQNYVVAAIITGPRQLKQNKTAEYKITIANQTGVPANNVLMHLAIPPGLKVLAAEPDAHYDQAKRMVS